MDGEILPDELRDELGGEEPLVVDIRNPREFERERIPDSVNVPLGQLPREVDRIADADHVVTVCPHGKASIRAARLVASFEGFDGRVESLHGGLEAWNGPLEPPQGEDDTGTRQSPPSAGGDPPDAPF